MVDVSTYATLDEIELPLNGPDGEPMMENGQQSIAVIYGPGSEEAEAVKAAQNKRNMELMKRQGGKLELSPAQLKLQRINRLVGRTRELRNVSHPGALADPAHLTRTVYSDRTIGFIAEQVEAAMDDWSRFTRGSATS